MYPIPANATRVRFLRSDGSSYINTGVTLLDGYDARIRIVGGITKTGTAALIGARENDSGPITRLGSDGGSNFRFTIDSLFNAQTQLTSGANFGTGLHTFDFSFNASTSVATLLCDAIRTTQTITSQTVFATCPLTIFGYNKGSSVIQNASTIIVSACQIWQGTTLVRSFVPVRVGQVGYLFDRVSGQLFGNAGTGDFVLGPDTFAQGVVPTRMMAMGVHDALPYTRIEYLYNNPTGGNFYRSHSSGAAIDTGIIPTSDLVVQLRATFLQYNVYGVAFGVETGDWSSDGFRLRRTKAYAKLNFYIGNESTAVENTEYSENSILNIECGNKYITINGSTTTGTQSSESEQARTLVVWCVRRNGNLTDYSNMRLYSLKLIRGTTVLRDFIPVRKGTTGYLYDKVSKQLFGNIGTRDFTLGPDK